MSESRSLKPTEITFLQSFFGNTIDYTSVSIVRGVAEVKTQIGKIPLPDKVVAAFLVGAHAPNGSIYYPETPMGNAVYSEDFSQADLNAQSTFIHEMAHVLQYQQGIDVINGAIRGRIRYPFDQDSQYGYQELLDGSVPFNKLDVEAMAAAFEDLWRLEKGEPSAYRIPVSLSELQAKIPPFSQWDSIGSDYDSPYSLFECFPAGTLISLFDGSTKKIEAISIEDRVLTFNSDGEQVAGHVDKLFKNTTKEFISINFVDGRDDLVTTPGHRFLTETGDYMEVGHMLRLGGGQVRLVDANGSIVEAVGSLLSYDEKNTHGFVESCAKSVVSSGGSNLSFEIASGWETYNFEVREHHNYVANDIRVHNDSILAFIDEDDQVFAVSEDFKDAAVSRDNDGNGTNEIVLLDGERFESAGSDTFLEVQQTFIPDNASADVEALLAQFIDANPEAASNVYDPGNGNEPGDGVASDDIVEILTDDIGGTFTNRSFGGVEVPSLAALILAAVSGGAEALVETLFAPLGDTNSSLSYASGDGDVSITPTGPDTNAILLFILGLDADAEIVPGIPDPFGGTIGGITLGDLLGGLDLPDMNRFEVDFGTGIEQADVTREQVGDDLILTVDNGDGTTNTMTLVGVYSDGNADEIVAVNFADGTSVPLEDIVDGIVTADGIVTGTEMTDVIDASFVDTEGESVGSGDDVVVANGGDDVISTLAGDDFIEGGAGADTINGGSGFDTVDYSNSDVGVTVGINNGGTVTGGHATGDVLSFVENITGSQFDDILTGNTLLNVLNGLGGDDTINGSSDADILNGGEDNDLLIGARGADMVDGGEGSDTASYSNAGQAIVVSTGNGNGTATGADQDGGDTLISIENIFGSNYNDTITGDAGVNTLNGYSGDDMVFGGGGDDSLLGQQGSDTLNGGEGNDTLRGGGGIDTLAYDTLNFGQDTVLGWQLNYDKFDFTALGLGYSDFTKSSVGGNTVLTLDSDPNQTITMVGINFAAIDANDFVV